MGLQTQNVTETQIENFRFAIRLHIAILLKKTKFQPACHECNNTSLPLCCLECEYIGCPRHSDHHHTLAYCMGNDLEGVLWSFASKDFVTDAQFDKIKSEEIQRAMSVHNPPQPKLIENEKPFLPVPYHASTGLRGLVNLGATCYASVVLQSLIHNPLVRAFFLGGGHQREYCTRHACLVCAVDNLFSNFFGSSSVAGYGITDLLVALAEKQPTLGAGSTEQDAHEFFLMLLNEFHAAHTEHQASLPNVMRSANGIMANGMSNGSASNGMPKDATNGSANGKVAPNGVKEEHHNSSNGKITNGTTGGDSVTNGIKGDKETCGCITHRVFAGTIESTLSCDCGKVTHRREPIVDLGVDLGTATSTTLISSLNRFVTPEPVANYTCDACGRTNTTTKQLKLSEPPPVLMIQLKRFKHVGGNRGSIKVETPVDFPLQMDIAPYTTSGDTEGGDRQPLIYELYGVICHIGTLDTGHYTCMMKHSSGQWYNFDDVTVTPIGVDTVKQAKRAYLLFYIVKWAI